MTAIETYRKANGFSQQALAKAINVSQGAISQWENGLTFPGVHSLKAMAKLFGCKVDDLLEEHSA